MIYFNGVKGKNYFEGWFFRVCADGFNCAFIPSVSVSKGVKRAYIQINCGDFVKKQEFDISDFKANDREVVIGGNSFSDAGIKFSSDALSLDVAFGGFSPLKRDIMGCFKFGTPCKHKIVSMRHAVDGNARLNGENIALKNAAGYIEKDWGVSFPKSYCWLQCNKFYGSDAAFFFSVADIGFPFLGLICVLIADGKEYRFATYNFSFIETLSRGEIVLKKSFLRLEISFSGGEPKPLLAPSRGEMNSTVKEALNGGIRLKLFEKDRLIYDLSGVDAGVEWVDTERLR